MIHTLSIATPGRGLYDITPKVREVLERYPLRAGLCTLFIRHTSASLLIQENADPAVRVDLEQWMERLAPEGDPAYTHTEEGPDDMPSHLRSAVTNVSLSIPISDGKLMLGRWQAIYVWEHRRGPHRREVVAAVVWRQ